MSLNFRLCCCILGLRNFVISGSEILQYQLNDSIISFILCVPFQLVEDNEPIKFYNLAIDSLMWLIWYDPLINSIFTRTAHFSYIQLPVA
jgi:hypothetical protein